MKRLLNIFLCLSLSLGLTSLLAVGSSADVYAADTTAIEVSVTYGQSEARKLTDMVNSFRTGSDNWYWNSTDSEILYATGLSNLSWDYDLEKVAMQRAAEIALSFSHTRPDGTLCYSAASEAGYPDYYPGENVAAGQSTAEAAFTSWLEEDDNYSGQGHRRNMLSVGANYTTIAVGHVVYNGVHYWAMELGTPTSSTNTTSPNAANDSSTKVSINILSSNITNCSMTLSADSLTMGEGDSKSLTVSTLIKVSDNWPGYNCEVYPVYTWSSSDESVASVDENGNVTAVSSGTATITVTSALGDVATCDVIVADSIENCTVTLEKDTYEYTGSEIKPAVTVMNGSTELTEGTDYEVSYSNNTAIGTATVTVTGIGSYSGSKTLEFEIVGKDLSDYTVTLDPDTFTYSGSANQPNVTVTDNDGNVLTLGEDYTVAYSGNVNAGTAIVTITGIGNYGGTIEETFTINAKNISDSDITISDINDYEYTGSEIIPEVTITFGNITLVSGSDYTLTCRNNTNAGNATVTITGNGNYTGSIDKTFTITAVDLSDFEVSLDQNSYTYSGNPNEPGVTVTDGSGNELTLNADYTVSYSDNVNVGTATVTITGTGNYTGTITATFTITAKSTDITASTDEESYTYTGSEITPDITVKDGDTTLTKDTDYTVVYTSTDKINVGTVEYTVTLKGNYDGTVTGSYEIVAKNIDDLEYSKITDKSYTGHEITPELTITYGDITLVEEQDYTLKYADNIDEGEATITVTGKGNYSGSHTVTFTIIPKSVEDLTYSDIPDQIYTGSEICPDFTVTDDEDDLVLEEDVDYEVTYSDNINVGKATIVVKGINDFGGEKELTFNIVAKSINDFEITLDPSSYTYNGNNNEPAVTVTDLDTGIVLEEGKDYTVSYDNNTDAGSATVIVTAQDNYKDTASTTFTINPKGADDLEATASASEFVYTGSKIDPDITVVDTTITVPNSVLPFISFLDSSSVLVEGTDYTVSYSHDVEAGEAFYTVTLMGNYTGEITGTYDIIQKDISEDDVIYSDIEDQEYTGEAITPAPTITYNGMTLVKGTDYTLEYKDNVDEGTATITVTGMGNYTSSKTIEFEITPKSVENLTYSDIFDQIYNGDSIFPDFEIWDGDKLLVEGVDYTVENTINVEAGTYTITITGIGDYVGVHTITYKILPKSIEDMEATLSQDSYTYNGEECLPEVTVKDGETTLVRGEDYEVTYLDNTEPGTATVTINGIGNYTGTITLTFTIEEPEEDTLVPLDDEDNEDNDGENEELAVTVDEDDNEEELDKAEAEPVEETVESTSAKTSDNTNYMVYVAALVSAGLCLLAIAYSSRKRRHG